MTRIIFVPGNGGCSTQDNWFPSVKAKLEKHNLEIIAATFPDPHLELENNTVYPFCMMSLKQEVIRYL